MSPIATPTQVLVTGGSGYIASWIIKYLLDEGHTVRATVRNLNDKHKYAHLEQLAASAPGTLEMWEADLLQPGSFDEDIHGCEVVFHVASPFIPFGTKDPMNQLIRPAVDGTRNVLEAVSRAGTVKRVVLTSSIVAMYGDAKDLASYPNQQVQPDSWNQTSNEKHQPYPYSKRLAEEEAWKVAKDQDWDLVVMNPGFVLGPSLTPRKDSSSIQIMLQLIDGTMKRGAPEIYLGTADVRDVARAHIKAAFTLAAKDRYIITHETANFFELGKLLQKHFPQLPLPTGNLPRWVALMLGPLMGMTYKYLNRNIGYPLAFNNEASKQDLGLEYTPLETTVVDMVQQLAKDGIIELK